VFYLFVHGNLKTVATIPDFELSSLSYLDYRVFLQNVLNFMNRDYSDLFANVCFIYFYSECEEIVQMLRD
jgi:hypothetical protein